jgi:predicted TPR repeat methyltransferase
MAIELGRRGFDVIGVDLDEVMLTQAQAKAPQMNWVLGDLSTVKIERRFDIIVLAGNVMIYLTPQTEKAVLLNMAAHLKAGGLLLAAFELNPYPWTNLTIEGYEQLTKAAGFREVARWSNWDQAAWQQGDGYVVYLTKK